MSYLSKEDKNNGITIIVKTIKQRYSIPIYLSSGNMVIAGTKLESCWP